MAQRDLDGLRAYAEELSSQFRKLRNGLTDLQKEMSEVTATAKSSDGYVTATVGPRGQLVKLHLDARIYRKPDSAQLAATITEAVQRATTEAAKKVDAVAARHTPGLDVGSYLHGDLVSRFDRFDFIHDQIAGGAD